MCSFASAFSLYGEMASTVDRVRPLDEHFGSISHNDFPWPA